MDVKRSKKNIVTAISFKSILLVLGILTTRYLIRFSGNEVNGLNSLFKSIVGFLSLAELGVGTAISYCMYKPIVDGNHAVVSALYKLFKRIYYIIGALILVAGLLILPFLPYLAKEYTVDVNIYYTYVLMLVSVVISYGYSAETSLINAYKDNYITTTIHSIGMMIQQVLQIAALAAFKSFELYLICRIVAVAIQWIVTSYFANKKHYEIMHSNESRIPTDLQKEIVRNVKAMFFHKLGGALVNSTGSIIISAFCGVLILGKYTNYTSIMTSMIGVLILFFIPLTSIIGHLYAENNGEGLHSYYNFFYGINYVLGMIFFLGYYAVIDDLIYLFYGNNLELPKKIVALITVSHFTQFFRQSTLLFRDSTGTFYYDRWKPLIEGLFNVVLSLVLINVLPEEIKLIAVLIANICSNLFVCHIVEPYILYKYVFKRSVIKYYFKNYLLILFFVIIIYLFEFIRIETSKPMQDFLLNGCLSVAVSIVSLPVMLLINKDFGYYCKRFVKKIRVG